MKRSKRGFTLVELLVVMAIISILASIVVPNVINYIRQSRAVRARADIASLESALVKIISDSGRSNLGQLFDPNEVRNAIGVVAGVPMTSDQMKAARELYTKAIYTILRDGRGALTTEAGVLNDGVVKRLGTSYIDIGFDPWGNLYNIYPGPWPATNGPVPFRKFKSESTVSATGVPLPGSGDKADGLTVQVVDPNLGSSATAEEVSFPAARDKVAFIWSNGENLVSGQVIYDPSTVNETYDPDDPNKLRFYDVAGSGGDPFTIGDDVNNWDNASSWSPFY